MNQHQRHISSVSWKWVGLQIIFTLRNKNEDYFANCVLQTFRKHTQKRGAFSCLEILESDMSQIVGNLGSGQED